MKIFLSPAKRLDVEHKDGINDFTEPRFIKKALTVMNSLKKNSPKKLMNLQHVNEDIAHLNYERNQNWKSVPEDKNMLQAGFMFDGEVYRGLRETELTAKEIEYLRENLYILSGLYGVLRFTDKVMPYRLEMGTDLPIGKKKNLYEYWQKTVTDMVNSETIKDEILLDLSSKEYMSVLDKKKLKGKIVNVKFMDMHQGKLKQITVYFKQARGQMAHFCARTNAQTVNDLKNFSEMGYGYDENLSKPNTLIFTR